MLPWYIKRKPPKRKPPQAPPREGMSLIRSHISSCFKLYPTKTSPPLEGLGEASLRGLLPCLWSSVVFTPLSIRRGVGGEAVSILPAVLHSHSPSPSFLSPPFSFPYLLSTLPSKCYLKLTNEWQPYCSVCAKSRE